MDHQNYAHYGAFHHVNLQSLRKEDEERFNELKGDLVQVCLDGHLKSKYDFF